MHGGNVLWRLSPQNLKDIAARNFALLFYANHESSDNAAAEIGVRHTKYRSIRCRYDHGKDIRRAEELPPLRILEKGKKINDGMAGKIPQSFL